MELQRELGERVASKSVKFSMPMGTGAVTLKLITTTFLFFTSRIFSFLNTRKFPQLPGLSKIYT